MSERRLPWAVIPVAGRGTRMLPASAVVPKVMLPVGTWPMLHWTLEEAIRADVAGIILVVGPEQGLVRDYLGMAARAARAGGTDDLAKLGRGLASRELRWVEQPEPRGVGDAFIRCRDLTGDEPFGVLLPDNWFRAEVAPIAQVARSYWKTGMCCLGLTKVAPEDTALFGNVGGVQLEPIAGDTFRVVALQDKLGGTFASAKAGALRGCARYVLGPEFYDALTATGPPPQGEWDDVPAFQYLISNGSLCGHRIHGQHYDVGLPAGYLAATALIHRRS